MGLMYEQVFRVPGHKAWIRENLEKAKKGTTWLLGAKSRRISDTWGDPHRRLRSIHHRPTNTTGISEQSLVSACSHSSCPSSPLPNRAIVFEF